MGPGLPGIVVVLMAAGYRRGAQPQVPQRHKLRKQTANARGANEISLYLQLLAHRAEASGQALHVRLHVQPGPTNLAPMLPDLPQTEVAIVELTNAFRKASALQEVKPNPALAAAARAFAEYLAQDRQIRARGGRPQAGGSRAGTGLPLLPRGREPRLEPQQPRLRKRASSPARSWKAGRRRPAIAKTSCCAARPKSAWPSCACRTGTRSFFRCSCSAGRSR